MVRIVFIAILLVEARLQTRAAPISGRLNVLCLSAAEYELVHTVGNLAHAAGEQPDAIRPDIGTNCRALRAHHAVRRIADYLRSGRSKSSVQLVTCAPIQRTRDKTASAFWPSI
jgi:hypothetical protein